MKRCPNVSPRTTNIIAGGTGYDPRHQATWSSDGLRIFANSVRTCRRICIGTATRALGSRSVVSGLAVNDKRSHLYQIETVPGRFAITVYDIRRVSSTNCFTRISTCTGTLPTAGDLAGGLAFDETRDLLYIATSSPTGQTIMVTRQAKPCAGICRFRLQSTCVSGRLLTGLAFGDCKGVATLYVTNGLRHLELRVGDPVKCQFTPGRCCNATGQYRGLALIPGWSLRHRGKVGCLRQPCPTCRDLHMETSGGDPSLGNPSFAIELRSGPAGGLVGFFLRPGGLGPAIPIFGCTLYTEPFSLGPFVLPISGSGCNGRAVLPLAVPADRALCGLKFAAQGIVVCRGGIGGMTDAIEIEITN